MKTTFSRLFALLAGVILLCLVLMGVAFRAVLLGYLEEETRESLQSNGETLSKLAAVYDITGELDNRWGDFRLALSAAAQMAGTDAILCSTDGQVRLCSCEDVSHCIHTGGSVPQEMIDRVLAEGDAFFETDIPGLYDEEHFIEGVAVTSSLTDKQIGVVLMIAPADQIQSVLKNTTAIFFYVCVVVLLVAMVGSYFLSRSQARSLEAVTKAATRFGHGELDARVAVGGKNTVEINELAQAFNAMAENLAQSETRRQEFVANVSHELKTPMTTISGFLDGMLDGTIPESQHRHYMQLVSDEVRRLSRLVRSMLDISRLQAQGISEEKKRRFDLGETIGQVLIRFEQRVNRKSLRVDVELPDRPVWTRADPDSITQVIYNLIDNAIKFCNEGGMLGIRLTTEGSKARVTIQNTGPTVPPEELPLLFDRFHKADKSRSADREGVGLGLYIVKTILGSHGEDITVTSENGLTAFTFTLPLVR